MGTYPLSPCQTCPLWREGLGFPWQTCPLDSHALWYICTHGKHALWIPAALYFPLNHIITAITLPPTHLLRQVLYFIGYSKGVGSRMWGAGAYFPQFALYGLTLTSAIFLMENKSPY